MKKRLLLIITYIFLFVLPFIGSYIRWGGTPPGFGEFPAQKVVEDPGFNLTYFIAACAVAFVILIFLLFPRLFGFKKPEKVHAAKTYAKFPVWFWPSLVVTLISWSLMWGRFIIIQPIDHYTFVPLWWGFILTIDGIVYKINNGVSLVSSKPDIMKLLAVVSSVSWFVFEFLNFFVMENWYYPNNEIFTNFGNISWQLLSYTTVLPAIFELYSLLSTWDWLKNRYAQGPVITISKPLQVIALIAGLVLTFLMGLFPFALFWVLWVSLIPALVPAMSLSKFWTPFTPIARKGNYIPVVLIALATLLNGFFWEFWNYGSEWFHPDIPTNPNYWKYSVPYLDKFHIFSQMPVLGYFGYLFFGIGCWILWVSIAHIVGFKHNIHLKDEEKNYE